MLDVFYPQNVLKLETHYHWYMNIPAIYCHLDSTANKPTQQGPLIEDMFGALDLKRIPVDRPVH